MSRTPPALRALRDRLFALDPTVDFEAFLLAATREILAATGASAVGVNRRFAGASRDFALLVPAQGTPARLVRSLHRDPDEPLSVPPQASVHDAFANPFLVILARETDVTPRQVFVIPVIYRGKTVVELELADPGPGAALSVLEPVFAETAVLFELAVVHARLRRERHESRHLLQVGKELGRTLDLADLLNSVLDLLRRVVPFDAAAIYFLDEDGLSAVHHSIRGYDKEQESVVQLKMDQGIVGAVARSGEGEIVSEVAKDPRYLMARPETRSEMVVPLKSGGRVIGVFNLESDRPFAYNPHEKELLETFAGHAAAALERARLLDQEKAKERLEQELVIARRIQESFLPKPDPVLEARGIAGRSQFSEEVSGDYYDFLERPDRRIAVAVADVSGKGIPAALIMSSLKAAFRYEGFYAVDPAVLCHNLNGFLLGTLRETEFVTGVFGFLDLDHLRFQYCNAGHDQPLLLRADGTTEWLGTGGMILGAFPGLQYAWGAVDLMPGDRLVLYTDGVTEAHPGNFQEYGTERLLAVVASHANDRSEVLCDAIIQDVRRYAEGASPDDLTVVVLSGRDEPA
jgi:sigma-B regulation protein RsbU (phosphoserine phosphatase)